MQTKLILASTALAMAMAAFTPSLAQEAAPEQSAPAVQGTEAAPAAPPAHPKEMKGRKHPMRYMHAKDGAEIKLNFGGGRMVAIECGEMPIDACIAASMPLIDKVASSEPVSFPPHGKKKD